MKAFEIEYRAHMRAIYDMAEERNWRFSRLGALLDKMEALRVARARFEDSETPESEALARWTLEDRRSELNQMMHAWCLTEYEKDNIRWFEMNAE